MVPGVISLAQCDALIRHVAQLGVCGAGSRNLLALPWCRHLALSIKAHPAIAPLLPTAAVAVQCTLFEKSTEKNWAVASHQDLSIPVRDRIDAPECTGWAFKEGAHYTQPPAAVLSDVVAIRVHLDACPPGTGPLRLTPGSHQSGRLAANDIERLRAQYGEIECAAGRGAALVMRPLLLHASSRITGSGVRRVLHFLFGPPTLPHGLHWHTAV